MLKASRSGAGVVHFPETALSGYGRSDLMPNDDNWSILNDATEGIIELAVALGLWVVMGSCRAIDGKDNPANCVHVISDTGQIRTYDKQKLTPAESEWYEPGSSLLVVEIRGVRCGFLICYEAGFPKLWARYENEGVRLVFHSSYNISHKPRPLLHELTLAQVRTRAADHGFLISHSTSSAKYSFSTAFVARPDGSVVRLAKHKTGILFEDFPI